MIMIVSTIPKSISKIQNLPVQKRKIILWSVVIIIGIALFIPITKNFREKLGGLKMEDVKKELNFPSDLINTTSNEEKQ